MFKNKLYHLFSEIDENTKVCSDPHFNHDGILRFESCRMEQMVEDGFLKEEVNMNDWFIPETLKLLPEKKEQMKGLTDIHNEWLIHRWNTEVQPDELVLCLGDFAWKGIQEILPRLNGRIIMILGNHDRKGDHVYKDCEHVVRGSYRLLNKWETSSRLEIAASKDELFSSLNLQIKVNGDMKNILFSHYPATITEEKWTKRTKNPNNVIQPRIETLLGMAPDFGISDNIHGHTHSRIVQEDKDHPEAGWWNFRNCSIENTNFAPIAIKELFKNKED